MSDSAGEYAGQRVTAMGLGRFGGQVAGIRYLVSRGAEVLVTDRADPATLTDSLQNLADLPGIRYRFGPHAPEDFVSADLILVSPAVHPQHACLRAAVERNVPIITEMELFLSQTPSRVVAVSGTVGKSTTATMLAHLLRRAGFPVEVGGNLGQSLLPWLDRLTPETITVLELSSFQLHWLRRAPPDFEVSVLTSWYPHHLDWHGSVEEYVASKQALFLGQSPDRLAVIPSRGHVASSSQSPPEWTTRAEQRAFHAEEASGLPGLPGDWPEHFLANAAAVLPVAEWFGLSRAEAAEYLADYRPLPHRLEALPDREGRRFINDTKATSPWAVVAGLRAVQSHCWVILGGALSADDPQDLLRELPRMAQLRGIAWMGPGGKAWQATTAATPGLAPVLCPATHVDFLAEAFRWCWEKSAPGDTILLSPGCPSFNEFLHYEARGEQFRQLAAGEFSEHDFGYNEKT